MLASLDGTQVLVAALGLVGVGGAAAIPAFVLHRGQIDIKNRIGIPNGNGDLSTSQSTQINQNRAIRERVDSLSDSHATLQGTVEAYIIRDDAAHDELRGLILAQDATARQVRTDLIAHDKENP